MTHCFSFAVCRSVLCAPKFWWGCQRQRSTLAEPTVVPCVPSVSVTGNVQKVSFMSKVASSKIFTSVSILIMWTQTSKALIWHWCREMMSVCGGHIKQWCMWFCPLDLREFLHVEFLCGDFVFFRISYCTVALMLNRLLGLDFYLLYWLPIAKIILFCCPVLPYADFIEFFTSL